MSEPLNDPLMKKAWDASYVRGHEGYDEFLEAYRLDHEDMNRFLDMMGAETAKVYNEQAAELHREKGEMPTDDELSAIFQGCVMVTCTRMFAFGMQLEIERTLDGCPTLPGEEK